MSAFEGERYTRTAIVLHWLIAALVLFEIGWGWWMQDIPKQPPGVRADAFNLHKSIGLTLLLLMLVRVGWRFAHPPPPLPPMPAWNGWFAHANHGVMYVVLFALTIGGYLGSAWSGYPVKIFGVALPSWSKEQPALKELASIVHLVASWVLVAALTLHVLGTAKHAWIDRNGLLQRMLPARRMRPSRATEERRAST